MGDTSVSVPVPAWIPRLSSSLLVLDRSRETLVHQCSTVTIRSSRLAGAESAAQVALLSFRSCHAKRQELWHAALRLLRHHVFQQPQHPNLVSVLGLADQHTSRQEVPHGAPCDPALVVMEFLPTSLYDAVHVDKLGLDRSDIVFIATIVLDTLRFLHLSGASFESTLTSRKVMMGGGLRQVKLRRFCSEWIRREAKLATDRATAYVMPTTSDLPGTPQTALHRAQRADLFAFGMLLLEMCTGDKPNPEICNSISRAGQIDERLERIVRATLGMDAKPAQRIREDLSFDDPSVLLSYCTRLLQECARDDCVSIGVVPERRSSHSFKSFLHADRYFLAHEASAVETQLAQRMAQSTVALKRLAVVEEELVEEQKNFDVVVKQLEQLGLDKAHDERHIKDLDQLIIELRAELLAKSKFILESQAELGKSHTQLTELTQAMEKADSQLQLAHGQRLVMENERQSLLVEILRLKDEKRVGSEERHDLARRLAETAAKVGGEQDAIEELEARYRQAIHRCEDEQKNRRGVERQLEALSRQLTAMEEERLRYCAALQITPTGHLDARASQHLVLELKEKEVQSLKLDNQLLSTRLTETHSKLEWSEGERRRLEGTVCPRMQDQIDLLQEETSRLTTDFADLSTERDSLQLRIAEAKVFADELVSTILALEAQVGELQKQVADTDKARRLRQCLTPNCDAPRYLVKPSGFCVDCEEKMNKERGKSRASLSSSTSPTSRSPTREHGRRRHRRQRSLDGATAILNNTMNAPILDLLKRIEVARDCDDESREESSLGLIAVMKQLGKLLKDTASLKEDLPECGVLRCILSVMEQFLSSPVVMLECCRTLSVVVFNHDRNRLILVAEGVLELLLRMLRAFPQEAKVQEAGAVLLTNLSHNCESNRQRILAAGGVEAVLEMMESFPRDAGIQKKSCWALLTLAGSDFMCDKIAALGGVGATLAAMLNCPHDEDVQHYGCWTLLNLVSGTKHVQDFARHEGVIEVVEAAAACFPDHLEIQRYCRDILELIHQSDEISS